jgi:hypothetical protein
MRLLRRATVSWQWCQNSAGTLDLQEAGSKHRGNARVIEISMFVIVAINECTAVRNLGLWF